MSENNTNNRRRNLIIAGGVAALVLGLGATRAIAHRVTNGHWGHPGHGWHHNLTPEAMRERMQWGAEHVLDSVDASDDQRASVDGLLDAAVPDILGFRSERTALREQFQAVLAEDELDATEVERLRAESVALMERASKRATAALLEIGDVLTPEQRQDLVDRWQSRHHR